MLLLSTIRKPMDNYTCTKKYDNLPFAHRQHKHEGHCSRIHGHSWAFEFTFSAPRLDHRGFVVDFGSLKWLKAWINDHFDHTLVLNRDDPRLEEIVEMDIADVILVDSCSSEGIAKFLYENIAPEISRTTNARLVKVVVHEDTKNSAQLVYV